MALNLKKNEKSMLDAWKWLKDANKAGKWVTFDYEGKTFNLQHVGSGDGGIEEIIEEFSDGRIMYGAVCVEDPNSGLPKIVFIVWQGLGVPENIRGKCAVHADTVLKFFKGYHVNITARGESDIDENTILDKVKQCSGANYGFHKEKPVPAQKQSHPVAVYEKIDPSKEISSSAREEFWKKDAQESTTDESKEKPSALRAQEVKGSRSAADAFKNMEQERLQKEKELEMERLKRQEDIKNAAKQAMSEKPETSRNVVKQSSQDTQNFTPGKTSAFKAMFEQKIDEQTDSITTKPTISRTGGKKWEPVQTQVKPVSVTRDDAPPPTQPRFAPEPIPERSPQVSMTAETSSTADPDLNFPSPACVTPEPQPSLPSRGHEKNFTVIALYDYDASDNTEISFRAGEKITDVVKDDEEWWIGTNSKGNRGQLPYNFVATEGSPEAEEVLEALAAEMESAKFDTSLSKAKVIYDYQAADTDELSLVENEVISILEKRNDGWWVAQNNRGETGLVPCNFVEE